MLGINNDIIWEKMRWVSIHESTTETQKLFEDALLACELSELAIVHDVQTSEHHILPSAIEFVTGLNSKPILRARFNHIPCMKVFIR